MLFLSLFCFFFFFWLFIINAFFQIFEALKEHFCKKRKEKKRKEKKKNVCIFSCPS